ncbi:hypothetical protein ACFWNF_18295 [Streptomyces anulatus]|uniref:hypothetical protein n=1 Tax=Streptomyces anulatus TaxID=1892 RepID=UPI00365CFCDD
MNTPESAAERGEARGTYKEAHTQMGKSAEDFGEKTAEHHFIAERYPEFEKQHPLDPKSVEALERALEGDRIDYVAVKGEKNMGTYTGYQYRRFDISKGTLP